MKIHTSNSIAALICAAGFIATNATTHGTVIDLIGGDTGSTNGAQFNWTPSQPTGTGVIDPFVRVQADGTEQGYNTSGGTPFDDKAGIWTHDIQFSDLQTTAVTVSGTQYFQVLLDVNEPGGNSSVISLDRLEFYTSATGSQTGTDVPALGSLRWRETPAPPIRRITMHCAGDWRVLGRNFPLCIKRLALSHTPRH